MLTRARSAWLLPASALSLMVLAGCHDRDLPTATMFDGPRIDQVASGPVVTSTADPGTGGCDDTQCTLREAIAFANAGATISFAVTGTITLTQGQLTIDKNLTLSGPGATRLTVSGNNVSRVFSVIGGTTVTISGLTVTGGAPAASGSYSSGGGIAVGGATLHLASVRVIGNRANNGGGINASLSTVTITGSTISGNTAEPIEDPQEPGYYMNGEGGGLRSDGSLTIERSTVSGNQAHLGGGIWSGAGDASTTILNSTVSGNTSTYTGGGVYVGQGTARISLSTIARNRTLYWGGGVAAYAPVTVKGSIIWGDTAGTTPDDVGGYPGSQPYTSLGYNLIGAPTTITSFTATGDQTSVDAKLGALTNNGGPTQTHSLLMGSPAQDQGTCTDHNNATVATDQRGIARPQGSGCEIGALEYTGSQLGAELTFDLTSLPAKSFGDPGFSVASYASTNGTSTGAITFALGIGSVGCAVSPAGDVTIAKAGTCIVEASLASDGGHMEMGPISQSFTIAKATSSIEISNMPTSGTAGGGFTPTFTVVGDGATSVESSTPTTCSVSGSWVYFAAAGTCTLVAKVAEGTNYLAATGSPQSVTIVVPFQSSCIPTINPKNDQRIVTVSWQNAEPGVTRIEVSDGRTVSKQLAPTASGEWSTKLPGTTPLTYAMWGGTSRRDASTVLVAAGRACVAPD